MEEFKAFLATKLVRDLDQSRDPLVLEEELTPALAFQELANAHIRAAPVLCKTSNTVIGTLDLRDTCKFFVEVHSAKNTDETEASRSKNPLQKVAEEEVVVAAHTDVPITTAITKKAPSKMLLGLEKHPVVEQSGGGIGYLAKMRPFKVFPPDTPLIEVAGPLSQGSHIIGVSGGDASKGGLSKIVTQGILFRAISKELAKVQATVEQVMKSPVLTLQSTDIAFSAFQILASRGISGLAVCDPEGAILANTSSSDLKMWASGESEGKEGGAVQVHSDTIEEFLVKLRAASSALKTRYPCSICHPEDTVGHVVGMLEKTGYHRVWVTKSNDDRRPCGVVSITDLLRMAC